MRLTLQRRSLSAVINASHRPEINRHPKCVTSNSLAEGKIIPLVGLCWRRISGREGEPLGMKKGKKHRGSFDASKVAGDFSEIVA